MNVFSENISFNVTSDMKEKLQKLSRRNEEKLSSTIRKILKEGISSRETKEKVTEVSI